MAQMQSAVVTHSDTDTTDAACCCDTVTQTQQMRHAVVTHSDRHNRCGVLL